jgi:hypothetical protein
LDSKSDWAGSIPAGRANLRDNCMIYGKVLLAWIIISSIVHAATVHSKNFTVYAATDEIAENISVVAEKCRTNSCNLWLKEELPTSKNKCPIHVRVTDTACSGETTYSFVDGELLVNKMNVRGRYNSIIDTVIPHEINHIVFAEYFKHFPPRWADEGAASTMESESEQLRSKLLLDQYLNTNKYIPIEELIYIDTYPDDNLKLLIMYSEGHSLVKFLLQKQDHNQFIKFIEEANEIGHDAALLKYYEYKSIDDLERDWKNGL